MVEVLPNIPRYGSQKLRGWTSWYRLLRCLQPRQVDMGKHESESERLNPGIVAYQTFGRHTEQAKISVWTCVG